MHPGRMTVCEVLGGAHHQHVSVADIRCFPIVCGSLNGLDDRDSIVLMKFVTEEVECRANVIVIEIPLRFLLPYASYTHLTQFLCAHCVSGVSTKKTLAQLRVMPEQHHCMPACPANRWLY